MKPGRRSPILRGEEQRLPPINGSRRRITFRDLALFIHAVRVTLAALPRLSRPLGLTLDSLTSLRRLPTNLEPEEAHLAASRAVVYLERWLGSRNTCLLRSMVLGTLLSDREDVSLNIGFRPTSSPDEPHAGHAWILVSGTVIGETDPVSHKERPYVVSKTLRMTRKFS